MYNVINDPLSEKRVYNFIIIHNNGYVYISMYMSVRVRVHIKYYVLCFRVKSVATKFQNYLLCIRGKEKKNVRRLYNVSTPCTFAHTYT